LLQFASAKVAVRYRRCGQTWWGWRSWDRKWRKWDFCWNSSANENAPRENWYVLACCGITDYFPLMLQCCWFGIRPVKSRKFLFRTRGRRS